MCKRLMCKRLLLKIYKEPLKLWKKMNQPI